MAISLSCIDIQRKTNHICLYILYIYLFKLGINSYINTTFISHSCRVVYAIKKHYCCLTQRHTSLELFIQRWFVLFLIFSIKPLSHFRQSYFSHASIHISLYFWMKKNSSLLNTISLGERGFKHPHFTSDWPICER